MTGIIVFAGNWTVASNSGPQVGECDPLDGPKVNKSAFFDKRKGILNSVEFSVRR
jgi:hypothetical protein